MNTLPYYKRTKHSLVGEIIFLKKELAKSKPQPPEDVFDIAMGIVQKDYDFFTFELMCGKTRKKEVVIPRQIWQHLLYKFTNTPVKTIGRKSNRHHSCIFNSTTSVQDRCLTDKAFKLVLLTMELEFQAYLRAQGVPEKSNTNTPDVL